MKQILLFIIFICVLLIVYLNIYILDLLTKVTKKLYIREYNNSNNYIQCKKNNNVDDYPLDSLENTFEKCYGNDWVNQPNLVNKYNIINSIT